MAGIRCMGTELGIATFKGALGCEEAKVTSGLLGADLDLEHGALRNGGWACKNLDVFSLYCSASHFIMYKWRVLG
jgi:hypothetical protein